MGGERETPRRSPVVVPEVPRVRSASPRPASPAEVEALRAEYDALNETKGRLAKLEAELQRKLDDADISRPIVVPPEMSTPGQPKVITSKTAIPVRLSLGTWLSLLGSLVTAIAVSAFFVARTELHRGDAQRHLNPESGIGWGVYSQFETREEAKAERKASVEQIEATMDQKHFEMQGELIRVLGGTVKYRRWEEEQKRKADQKRKAGQTPTQTAPIAPEDS